MAWSFELYFDAKSAGLVRTVSDPHLYRDLGEGTEPAWPHVTLGVTETINESAVRELLPRWATEENSVAVKFDHWGFFFSNSVVLFLSPAQRDELGLLQRRFFQTFEQLVADYWDYYLPDHWVPHCIAWEGLSCEQLARASRHVSQLSIPLMARLARLDRLALVEFGPGRHERLRINLGAL